MDAMRRRRILRQHIETDRLLGVEAVPRAMRIVASQAFTALVTESRPDAHGLQSVGVEDHAPNVAASAAVSAAFPTLDRETRLQTLEEIDQQVRGCTDCTLCQGRTHTVFGEGDPEADILFIGEGPGQAEDEQGRPFVGPAGELLDKMIQAMGLSREQVYITNVVKCRPPNNRTPAPAEVEACWGYLRRQIETIQPKVIVTLGSPAAKMILGTTTGITRLRGQWHSYPPPNIAPQHPPIPVMPTFHPAYLLRSYTRENRARVWSDLQAVMERVGSR